MCPPCFILTWSFETPPWILGQAVYYIYFIRVCIYSFCRPYTYHSLPYNFSFCSLKLDFTIVSCEFLKLIEIQAIFLQVFLDSIEGSFVRVRRSEQDVNTCWKEKAYFSKSQVYGNRSWLYCVHEGKAHGSTVSNASFIQLHFTQGRKILCSNWGICLQERCLVCGSLP
jgi:hypothetical protein